MFTRDDLADVLMDEFARLGGGGLPSPGPRASPSFRPAPFAGASALDHPSPASSPARAGAWADGPRGRRFLSEFEVKSILTPGSQVLKIPPGAILSPLAQDWLTLKGIRVVSQ